MSPPEALAAQILRASASGLASLTAERLLARRVEPEPGLDRLWASVWRAQLRELIEHLALALDEGRPGTLLRHVSWQRAACAARGAAAAELSAGLACLADVLRDELPELADGGASAYLARALASLDGPPAVVPPALLPHAEHGELTARYLVALLEGDRAAATRLLTERVDAGTLSVRDALLHVCVPAQREVGRMWHLDELSIGEEHAVSAATVRIMSQLMQLAPEVAPTGKTALAAAVGDDAHDIGLRLVSQLFELDGWRVVFLGSGLPADDFAWSAQTFDADLALLSAATDAHRRRVTEAITLLRAARPTLPVLVGGPGFDAAGSADRDALWRASGADAGAVPATDAVAVGRRLVGLDPS